jgi:hypothetical protein
MCRPVIFWTHAFLHIWSTVRISTYDVFYLYKYSSTISKYRSSCTIRAVHDLIEMVGLHQGLSNARWNVSEGLSTLGSAD